MAILVGRKHNLQRERVQFYGREDSSTENELPATGSFFFKVLPIHTSIEILKDTHAVSEETEYEKYIAQKEATYYCGVGGLSLVSAIPEEILWRWVQPSQLVTTTCLFSTKSQTKYKKQENIFKS